MIDRKRLKLIRYIQVQYAHKSAKMEIDRRTAKIDAMGSKVENHKILLSRGGKMKLSNHVV